METHSSQLSLEQSLLEYKGQLSSEVRIQLLDLLKCIALFNLGPRSDLKKLIGVALELLDNAQRYNSREDVDFRWHIAGSMLVVTIRNKARRADAERLVEAVNNITAMSAEEVTEAFKRQLTNQQFGELGGAGLGMLQIARKVGRNISASIEPTTENEYLCTSMVRTELERNAKRA